MTQQQMELADRLDEMRVGASLKVGAHTVKRESPTRYVIDGQRDRFCFFEAYDFLKASV